MSNLKYYKPVTPSLRQVVLIDKKDLWKGKPYKPLTKGLTKTGGRNNLGRLTAFHKGGGHKRKYRVIDFKRNNPELSEGIVERLEYDPNRSGFIALIKHSNNTFSYILAPQNLSVGDKILSSLYNSKLFLNSTNLKDKKPLFKTVDIKVGNTLALKDIPIGAAVHNIEMYPGNGGIIARSAGTFAQLVKKDEVNKEATVKLPSGYSMTVSWYCGATIGIVSNENFKNISLGKAGRKRWLGRRPVVRGVAMNPVDHPHGGGEGKTSGGRPSVTPWGKPTKGKKTRNLKRKRK